MTPDQREQASESFLDHQNLAYIRVENLDGVRTCILFDDLGDPIVLSEQGMVPLFSFAVNHGMTVCAVH